MQSLLIYLIALNSREIKLSLYSVSTITKWNFGVAYLKLDVPDFISGGPRLWISCRILLHFSYYRRGDRGVFHSRMSGFASTRRSQTRSTM